MALSALFSAIQCGMVISFADGKQYTYWQSKIMDLSHQQREWLCELRICGLVASTGNEHKLV